MLNRIVLLSVVSMLAVTAGYAAETERAIERFTFAPADAPKTGLNEDRLPLVITRWSTDAERDQVFDALTQKDQEALALALRSTPYLGHLRWPGGLEYTVRYARKTARADGEDVTLILDHPVWVWWKPEASLHAADSRYTVVHLRLGTDGGQGTLVSLGDATADKQAGVMVSDSAAPPALITDLRRERLG
jgi:hypothetical protein